MFDLWQHKAILASTAQRMHAQRSIRRLVPDSQHSKTSALKRAPEAAPAIFRGSPTLQPLAGGSALDQQPKSLMPPPLSGCVSGFRFELPELNQRKAALFQRTAPGASESSPPLFP